MGDKVNILAIDQGTSATKALLVGADGEVLGRGEVPVRTRSVGAGGVEADPAELYESVAALARLGAGDAASMAEAVGPAEPEATVDLAITADEAAERIVAFRSALPLALAGR